MARKKNKVISKFSSYEMGVWLEKTEKMLSKAQNRKDFDVLKPVIIKMLGKIKKNPQLSEFEPSLISILKEVNLNLQFIRRNDDCWQLVNSGNSKEALDEIIHALKDLNNHPDKHLIKPEIKGLLIDSIKKISEMVESEVKILNRSNFTNLKNQTIMPADFSKQSSTNTFKPKIEIMDPFNIPAPKINPFDDFEEDGRSEKDLADKSETYFRPKPKDLIGNDFESKFAPFPKNDNAQRISTNNLNSINTYWEKVEKKGETDEKEKNINEKTQMISKKKTQKKNEKNINSNNPWPQSE